MCKAVHPSLHYSLYKVLVCTICSFELLLSSISHDKPAEVACHSTNIVQRWSQTRVCSAILRANIPMWWPINIYYSHQLCIYGWKYCISVDHNVPDHTACTTSFHGTFVAWRWMKCSEATWMLQASQLLRCARSLIQLLEPLLLHMMWSSPMSLFQF